MQSLCPNDEDLKHFQLQRRKVRSELGREPSALDMLARLDYTSGYIDRMMVKDEIPAAVDRALNHLTSEQYGVIRLRLGSNQHTLEATASQLGITPEQVRMDEVTALAILSLSPELRAAEGSRWDWL